MSNQVKTKVATPSASTVQDSKEYDSGVVAATESLRKDYVKVQPANWYRESQFYTLYMLRELTAVPVAFEALNLFWGLASLAGDLSAWQAWVNWQSNALMLVFHALVIVAALYNSATWFAAMPKAMRIQRGEKFVPDGALIGGSWVTLVVILLVLAGLVMYFA